MKVNNNKAIYEVTAKLLALSEAWLSQDYGPQSIEAGL